MVGGNRAGRKVSGLAELELEQEIADDPKLKPLNWKSQSIQKYVKGDKDRILTKLRANVVPDVLRTTLHEEKELSFCEAPETPGDLKRIHLLKYDPSYTPSYKGTNVYKFHAYNFSPMELHVQKIASSQHSPILIGCEKYHFHKISTEVDRFVIDNVNEVTSFTMIDQRLDPFATLVQDNLDDAKFYNSLMEWLSHVGKFTLPVEVVLHSEMLVDTVCRAFYKISKRE
ncbi:hypothetical protein QAD02_003082 [Eretmocerus hayati]|uniref:Uncharacterized protein n=1 Tax=Eretmocerus hayati TaxID=131215 RepID=A0ACC2NLY8_9HYME|nr:hypothetical protein QAD02_003082 [Eretmocerus hayati]